MQLSARILTALAVLAFVVGVVVGAQNANDQVSAATGTIDALNVGACTTNNADVFNKDNHCSQLTAFYQQGELGDLIEVDTVYATYAHDPQTAAEAPRAILDDANLIRVSVTDKDRDRRDPVLITSSNTTFDSGGGTSGNPFGPAPVVGPPAVPQLLLTATDDPATVEPTPDTDDDTVNPQAIVAESAFGDDEKTADLPGLEQVVEFSADDTGATANDTIFESSGSYQVLFQSGTEANPYKPIAPDGTVKFFGRVNDGIGATAGDEVDGVGPFRDIGTWIKIDEDVISGETDIAPAIKLNISVPNGGVVQLQLIYYETSGIEYIEGGVTCEEEPAKADTSDWPAFAQAECTADERKPIDANEKFVLYAESDVDAGGDGLGEDAASERKNLALIETERFSGVFQGYVRLTDADGDGGGNNWGLSKTSGSFNGADPADGDGLDQAPNLAVLGVGNGPVVIVYKDSGGANRSFNIELDIEPPTIQIDSPAHETRSDDEKPSFIGTFNDSDSGLAADTFQLNVDNRPTQNNGPGDNNAADNAGYAMSIDPGVEGPEASAANPTRQVLRRLDYTGFADQSQFGLITGDDLTMELYKAGDDVDTTEPTAPNRVVEADDFDDGAPDGEFNEEIEIDFDEIPGNTNFVFNDAIDFQATVRDLAGNIGFSDSDAANPRFIDDLGKEKEGDRKEPNILGYFSAHVVHIDDMDPVIQKNSSVTGFYGLDSDDNPIRDRSAVMVVFDGGVNGDLIDTGTFTLEYEDESGIAITDVNVDGKLVFLKLGEELASDATPTLSITEGREVEDMAGNILSWQEKNAEAFEVKDGIRPVFTVTLSGGSGTGVGRESPSKLTSTSIDIAIASDEDINAAPSIAVVCSNIGWTDSDDKKRGLTDYVNNRTGYELNRDNEGDSPDYNLPRCGDAETPNSFNNPASLARPGNNWVYAWRNLSAPASKLADGSLVVVVWGRDRSKYDAHASGICDMNECENWGSETATFVLDNTFNSPLNADGSGGSVQPGAGDKVKEPRPFVLLDFAGEPTTVKVTEFKIDGEDAHSSLETIGDNRFLYWPEDLAFGTHKIEFDARDAADNNLNDQKTSFEFDVTARDPFVLDLSAGWNAVSFPANPVDTALDAVFTDEAIDRVIGWNPLSSNGPWSIATRVDGVWSTSANFAPLTDVVVRYGYWVHSSAFVKQSVDLRGPINRETGGNPDAIGIVTVPGWNFVGVVDQDGDQTENHFDEDLKDSEGVVVNAKDYMPGFVRAYEWDGIANGYRILDGTDAMKIGQGIWVFFPDDNAIAP